MVKWISLVTVVTMMLIRSPKLFVFPRFWAEEGTYFFAYAYAHSWLEGVVAHHFSYFSLFQNLCALVASRIPLEYSPLITVYGACFFQAATCAVVIWGDNDYLRGTATRFLMAVAMVLLASGEVWLSTNATQYWLCAAAFFILLERDGPEKRSVARKWFFRFMLVAGGINGIVPSFLAPVYLYKAWREKGREAVVQAGIMTLGAMVQGTAVVLHQLGAGGQLDGRMSRNLFEAWKVLFMQFVWPYAAGSRVNVTELLGQAVTRLQGLTGIDAPLVQGVLLVLAGVVACAVGGIIVMALVAHQSRSKPYAVGSFLLVFVLSTLFAIYMSSSPRYVFAPAVMLFAVLVKVAVDGRRGGLRTGAVFVLILTLATNARQLKAADYFSTELPAWRDEVGKWRRDAAHALRIWPSSDRHRWFIRLESPRPEQ